MTLQSKTAVRPDEANWIRSVDYTARFGEAETDADNGQYFKELNSRRPGRRVHLPTHERMQFLPGVQLAESGRVRMKRDGVFMFHTMKIVLPCALLTASLLGCTSVKSTALNRTETDVFIGNSNGKPRAHCAARPFNGVPITLRVPTHLDVVIKEKIYLKLGEEKGSLSRLKADKRSLFVETQIIETDKVFTVDPKRPAAGQLDYTMKFGADESGADGGKDNSQYFSSIKSRIQDDTIKDITGALSSTQLGTWPQVRSGSSVRRLPLRWL